MSILAANLGLKPIDRPLLGEVESMFFANLLGYTEVELVIINSILVRIADPVVQKPGQVRRRISGLEGRRNRAEPTRTDHVQLAIARNRIPEESALPVRPRGCRIVDFILQNGPAQLVSPNLRTQPLGEVPAAHLRRRETRMHEGRGGLKQGPVTEDIESHEEEGLMLSVIQVRNLERAAKDKPFLVPLILGDHGQEKRPGVEELIADVTECRPVEVPAS